MLNRHAICWITLVGATGCAQFPEPIYKNQVDAFQDIASPPGFPPQALHDRAATCSVRSKRHRSSAMSSTYVRYVLTALGGVAGGAGGLVAGVVPDTTSKEVGGWIAFSGGLVALGSTVIIPLISDPTPELVAFGHDVSNFDAAAIAARDARAAAQPTTDERSIALGGAGELAADLSAIGDSCDVNAVRGTWLDGPSPALHECSSLDRSIQQGTKLSLVRPVGTSMSGTCIFTVTCQHRTALKKATTEAIDALERCAKDSPANPVPPNAASGQL